jgi:hypothetical protein
MSAWESWKYVYFGNHLGCPFMWGCLIGSFLTLFVLYFATKGDERAVFFHVFITGIMAAVVLFVLLLPAIDCAAHPVADQT